MSAVFALLVTMLALTSRVAVGILLIVASIEKLRLQGAFRDALAGYRIVPTPALGVAAIGIPLLEFALGAGLLAGVSAAIIAAIALLLGYAMAMGVNLVRGRSHIDCGCSLVRGRPLSARLIVRNVVLAAMAALALTPAEPLSALVLANAVLAGILLYVLYLMSEALLALPAVTRGRVAWKEGQ